MAFCSNCGKQLDDKAKFCSACGASRPVQTENENKRNTVYEGEIHKCPNCGEVLDSFLTRCPSCGMELRGSKATNAVRELALKLETIEAHREYEKPKSIFKLAYSTSNLSKTDEQKVSLIRSFSIPNTKEDIVEFMILATANVDMSSYADGDDALRTASARAVSNAWLAKCEQAYEKAKASISPTDSCYIRIEELYQKTKKDLKKSKGSNLKKILKTLVITYGIIFAMILVVEISDRITAPAKNKAEEERLTAIVTEIEENLESGKYKLALMNAESMKYKGRDNEAERRWNIKKEYLIDEIINEAAENGEVLERSEKPVEDADSDKDKAPGGFVGGFKKGYNDALNKYKGVEGSK